MNAFYFVIDENLVEVVNAQAYHIAKTWACDVHIFIEKQNKNTSNIEVNYNNKIKYHYNLLMQFLPQNLPNSSKWPLIVYLRLFAPRFLKGYNRVLYLDADILSIRVAQNIWTIPLPYGVGAVTDYGSLQVPPRPFDKLSRSEWLQHIGVTSSSYLNSGVLLIDVSKWVQINFTAELKMYFDKYPHAVCFDQDFLASFLNGNWTDIGPIFNYQAVLLNSGLSNAIAPVFVHFSQPEKPWYGWIESGSTNLDPYFGKIYRDLLTEINIDPSLHERAITTKFAKKIKTRLRKALSVFGLRSQKEKNAFSQNEADRRVYIKNIKANGFDISLTETLDEIYFDGRNIRSKFTFPKDISHHK